MYFTSLIKIFSERQIFGKASAPGSLKFTILFKTLKLYGTKGSLLLKIQCTHFILLHFTVTKNNNNKKTRNWEFLKYHNLCCSYNSNSLIHF